MQISDPNLHLKLQEMCDCYLETDFESQLSGIGSKQSDDIDEDAVRYLALALMYAITEQAGKLSLKKKGQEVAVKIKSDKGKISLPSPGINLFDSILRIIRAILHIDSEKGESLLSLGLRSGDVEMQVRVKEKEGQASLRFKFG